MEEGTGLAPFGAKAKAGAQGNCDRLGAGPFIPRAGLPCDLWAQRAGLRMTQAGRASSVSR
jgi:hypothetical protein